MKVEATYSNIWKISYPIMLGGIAQTILHLTDTMFLARVGEVELGAGAVAGVFYFVLVMLGMAIAIGSQILMSRKAGEGNKKEIGFLFDHCTLILWSMSMVLFLLMQFGAPALFRSMLQSEDVQQASVDFIKYRSYGIFFILTTHAFRSFYTSISQTRIISYSAIVLTGSNVILAYGMILGKFGFEAEGIVGAGKASAISECIAALYLIVYTILKKDIKEFGLFKFSELKAEKVKSIISISSPIVLQNLLSMGAWFLFFVFIERIGQHELAISNVVRATYMVLMTPIWGYSSATNSMVSNLIGQGRSDEVLDLVKKIIKLSLLTTAVICLLNFIQIDFLLALTASDLQLVADALPSYYVVLSAMFVFSIAIVALMAVSGTGKTQVTMYIEIFNIFIYLVLSYIFAVVMKASLPVVWSTEIYYWAIMGLFAWCYLKSNKWKN
ncbi:MAG TPA: MATE family efflux transporter [Bacteroidia bacterium]|nr:MATE family efflux transporter [Bacteroidia bacterium]HNU34048.1 MATE family efflux transporter [Bacteroidia bacterium]